MEAALRQFVIARARGRCEYCQFPQEFSYLPFQVDHIIAQQHRGSDVPDNLALCCRHCNLLKGSNLTSLDPDSDRLVRLFHPRKQLWHEHFHLTEGCIRGRTNVGRTTVFLLEMNAPHRVELRLVNLHDW